MTASWDNSARIWDAATGEHIASLEGHKDTVVSASFSPDGTRIVTASCGVIHVSEKKHGCVQRALWEQIVVALTAIGVELLPQGASFGGGVRWTAPRERRESR